MSVLSIERAVSKFVFSSSLLRNRTAINEAVRVASSAASENFQLRSCTEFNSCGAKTLPRFMSATPALSVYEKDSSVYLGKNLPHGGTLISRMVLDNLEKDQLLKSCNGSFIDLSDRNACDVELIVNGGFSPLTGFMNEEVYKSVLDNMRLSADGLLFGLPVVLDTDREDVKVGDSIALHYQDKPIAVMKIDSKFTPDKAVEALKCYGTSSLEHPGTLMIATERKKYYIGGEIYGLAKPDRVFPCKDPADIRSDLPADRDVVAFQCRNPVHRAHFELFTRALFADNVGPNAVCLVHPTCGPTQDDDIPGPIRYQTYVKLAEEVDNPNILWEYLPYSMHMAGPREAIQHMILRKNYGCTHFIIGRDMAGSKSSITKEDFYGAYDAQDLAKASAAELGIQTVPSLNVVYTAEKGYITADVAKEHELKPLKLSGTEFRRKLRAGEDIPEWFAFKSVVEVLRKYQ